MEYYTQQYDDNAPCNARDYCELCGKAKDNRDNDTMDDKTTASETLIMLAQMYQDNKIAVEIILMRLANPSISLRQMAIIMGVDRSVLSKHVQDLKHDCPSLSKFINGSYYGNYSIQQTNRYKASKGNRIKSDSNKVNRISRYKLSKEEKEKMIDVMMQDWK